MIGQRIGRYVVRRRLAEGGMGAVYIATHERLENVTKVVKTLLPGYASNPALRDRFEREALAVSRLRHKHIITIDDYGQLPDGQLFLMMPFLRGQALNDFLRARGGTCTEHFALHVIVQVCSALQHMHDAAVIHRDIKPSNVFIVEEEDNPYRVYLIDLGIAKSLREREGLTRTGASMGTPAYMAVEQYEDAAHVTPLADLYAVAIMTWEMVSGSLPWGMHSTHVLYDKQKHERPDRPSRMSDAWYRVLSSALAVRPADRPASMRAFAVALASSVEAIPPHVPSGTEILAKLARTFVDHATPEEETIRKSPDGDRLAPIQWPRRSTRRDAELPTGPTVEAPPTPPMPPGPATRTEPTRVERPAAAVASRQPRRRRLALAALVFAGAVGVVLGLGWMRDPSTESHGQVRPTSVAAPVPSVVLDAGTTPGDGGGATSDTEARAPLSDPPAPTTDRRAPAALRVPEPARPPARRPTVRDGKRAEPAAPATKKFNPNAAGGDD